ncbi:MAG: EamA family transporter, partial [Promethearchaeota archaeon]
MLLTYLLLFLMIFLWGFSFIVVDIAMDFVPPLSIALYRLIIAAISMIIVDWFLREKKNKPMTNSLIEMEDENSNKQYWLFIFLASLAGVSLYLFIIYSAIDLIGPSIPVFSDCLINPILITIIALVVFKE